eukprot:15367064-Ditylum_brightwellii.AAC.1
MGHLEAMGVVQRSPSLVVCCPRPAAHQVARAGVVRGVHQYRSLGLAQCGCNLARALTVRQFVFLAAS